MGVHTEQEWLLTQHDTKKYSAWDIPFVMMYLIGLLMTVGFSVILPALFAFMTDEVSYKNLVFLYFPFGLIYYYSYCFHGIRLY